MSSGETIDHQQVPTVRNDISAMYRTNYMGFASFTMLMWDHFITFDTEVEYIWKGRKGLLAYLFLINRYLTPLGFIVNLFAYLSPVWTPERCGHFIRFEGSMTVIGINIVALMMFLRIKALYSEQYFVLAGVLFLYICQLSMNSWLLTRGVAVVHNELSGVLSCTMIFDPSISIAASSSAWLPLLYDTVAFALVLNRTYPSLKNKKSSFIMRRLLEDGLIYFSAIFAVTGVLTIMIIAAPPGLKNITAQLELLLTVAMMSRITLSLKKSFSEFQKKGARLEFPSFFTRKTWLTTHNSSIRIISPPKNGLDVEEHDLDLEDRVLHPTPMITVAFAMDSLAKPTPILPSVSVLMPTWGNAWHVDGLGTIEEVHPN